MTRATGYLTALAILGAVLTAAQASAQAQEAASCPPGMQLVSARINSNGEPVAAYCAAAPQQQGVFDPYTGGQTADVQGTRTDGSADQVIPPSR